MTSENPNLSVRPSRLSPSSTPAPEGEDGTSQMERMLEDETGDSGYTLVEVESEPETSILSAPVVAWILAGLAGIVAPFGSAALLDWFPGLAEGLLRVDRSLLSQVNYPMLGLAVAGFFALWAVVFSALIVCVGKRPGFGTGSALAAFLIGPPAVLIGLPAVAVFLNG